MSEACHRYKEEVLTQSLSELYIVPPLVIKVDGVRDETAENSDPRNGEDGRCPVHGGRRRKECELLTLAPTK